MLNENSIEKRSLKYSVQLHSPLGIKNGTLMLQYDKNELAGKLNILNTQCSIFNVSAAGENIEFRCDIDTVIGDITCEVHLTDKSGKLYGMVQTNKGCMAITGQKLFS